MKLKTLLALGSITLLFSSCFRAHRVCTCWTRPGLADSSVHRYELGKVNPSKADSKCRSFINAKDTCELDKYK